MKDNELSDKLIKVIIDDVRAKRQTELACCKNIENDFDDEYYSSWDYQQEEEQRQFHNECMDGLYNAWELAGF